MPQYHNKLWLVKVDPLGINRHIVRWLGYLITSKTNDMYPFSASMGRKVYIYLLICHTKSTIHWFMEVNMMFVPWIRHGFSNYFGSKKKTVWWALAPRWFSRCWIWHPNRGVELWKIHQIPMFSTGIKIISSPRISKTHPKQKKTEGISTTRTKFPFIFCSFFSNSCSFPTALPFGHLYPQYIVFQLLFWYYRPIHMCQGLNSLYWEWSGMVIPPVLGNPLL